jgi:Domain of Unknown Function (DUF349)
MDSQWGRIDADGTVYVKTPEGEREIGSWQAGDAAAGLAFYQRRYADLATEVDLLERRLASGAGDPRATRKHAEELAAQLDTAAAIGDLAGLRARLAALIGAADAKTEQLAAAREQARADAIAAKERLVAEAEAIAESGTSWKSSGDRLRAIVEEWKQIRGVDRKSDEALWRRFAAARDAFGKRRGQHFAELDAARDATREVKEGLIKRAEELATSQDWKQTALDLRELMTQWKSAGRASREVEDALWQRFRAAQDAFFARRASQFASREAEQLENLRTKEAIVAEVEALDVTDPRAAQAALRDLQARFEDVGHIPRESIRRVDQRLRAAEQRIRAAAEAQWRAGAVQSSPFLAALRERLAEAEEKLARARKSGDEDRIAKAETEVAQRRSLIPD